MILKFLIKGQNDPQANTFSFNVNESFCVIGRVNAHLEIKDSRCSKQHALLYESVDGQLKLKDLGSTNGTFVNGKKIKEAPLVVGDEVRIARTLLILVEFKSGIALREPQAPVNQPPPLRPRPIENTNTNPLPESGYLPEDNENTFTATGIVTNRWPDNFLAHPKGFQEQFIDHIDHAGEKQRLKLEDILAAKVKKNQKD